MLADLVRKHSNIVASWAVEELDHEGPNIRVRASLKFRDGSTLHVRQVVIGVQTFKYAYHWQDAKGNLICRWDNAPHWKALATYPHHRHVGAAPDEVQDSGGGDLSLVLEEIAAELGPA